jgi:hypothetical protein
MPKQAAVSKKKTAQKPAATNKPARAWRSRFRYEGPVRKPLPNVWRITRSVSSLLWKYKKTFASLALIYGVLNLALVRGFAGNLNVSELKAQLDQVFSGQFAALATSITVFTSLVSTSGNTSSSTGGAYQIFLLLVMSLAVIWSLRMVIAGETFRLRDSFYKGMYPLVPFLLVLVVVSLQLLPLLAGGGIYSTVVSSGVASNTFEQILWGLSCSLLVALSFYWLTASVFALYIVTLPNMTPLKALRSAKELVRGRRLSVLRKLLFLPVALFIVAVVIMLPIILVAAPLAQWLFFLLTMCSLIAVHAYMYSVYRELLG